MFNPFSVWTQVPISRRSVKTLKSAPQYGTITVGVGTSSNTATITAVDTAKTIVHYLGVTNIDDTSNQRSLRLTLTNSTTVTASTSGNMAIGVTVGFVVEERE